MLETLLALLLAAAPSAPLSWMPVDSLISVVAQVGNRWDPDGKPTQADATSPGDQSKPVPEVDSGNN